MFGLGMGELLVILAVALLVLGPTKLPELASGLGKAIRDFRRATRDLKDQIEVDETVRRPFQELSAALRDEPPPPPLPPLPPLPESVPASAGEPGTEAVTAVHDVDPVPIAPEPLPHEPVPQEKAREAARAKLAEGVAEGAPIAPASGRSHLT